jgi:hypothetical protein
MCNAHGVLCTTGGEAFGARSFYIAGWRGAQGTPYQNSDQMAGRARHFFPLSGFVFWLMSWGT